MCAVILSIVLFFSYVNLLTIIAEYFLDKAINYISDLTFNPTQLILISNEDSNGIFNFTITLLPDSHDTEYFITVSPSLPYGPDEMTTASSTIISLEKTTQYNITILSSTCTERNNRTFVFGKIRRWVIVRIMLRNSLCMI